jgi:hypothetical protein
MNARIILNTLLTLALAGGSVANAHLIGDYAHDHATPKYEYDFTVKPPLGIVLRDGEAARDVVLLAAASPGAARPVAGTASGNPLAARVASIFTAFAPKVKTRADDKFVYVESDAMPDHVMMVGITAWQQQVPIPQPYSGENAWRIPLYPVVAKNPLSAKSHFFRGAIALAANGVPIFNPIKNDGRTDTFLAGELDQFGGHCGRADDYHYHIAPTHLQSLVGKDKPVARARLPLPRDEDLSVSQRRFPRRSRRGRRPGGPATAHGRRAARVAAVARREDHRLHH